MYSPTFYFYSYFMADMQGTLGRQLPAFKVVTWHGIGAGPAGSRCGKTRTGESLEGVISIEHNDGGHLSVFGGIWPCACPDGHICL